ncbi:MAG: FHA domain-containing protein [Syntrophobacteraceae bacterium]
MPRARLVMKDSPTTSYPINGDELIIGRAEECDIRLPDRFVSRRQACLRMTGEGYELENLGANPTLVNGAPLDRKLLIDEDLITLGKTQLVFRLEKATEPAPTLSPEQEAIEAMTVFLTVPQFEPHGPRFLITDPEGKSTVHVIEKDALLIGRSSESDIHLNHSTVSRRQAVVRFRDGIHVIRNVSAAASLALNGSPVTEERLYTGDELTMGAFRLTFLSDRPEDLRPVYQEPQPMPTPARSSSWPAWVALVVVLLGAGSYMAYDRWYLPMKSEQSFELVLTEASRADFSRSKEILGTLLETDLPSDVQDRAQRILTQRTLAEAKRLDEAGSAREARSLLSAHLTRYGAGGDALAIQNLLDEYRFREGQRQEASGDYLSALQEFSTITIESPLYTEAQQAVSRIWQSYQQKSAPQLPTSQLLEEAEAHFAARRYTTPLGNNAYALYKSVLALDPNNQTALQRIEEMKAFYREIGTRYYQQKNCPAALSYLERYLVIDPQDPDIREKANSCTKGASVKRPKQTGGSPMDSGSAPSQQDRVRNLLEDPAAQTPPR